MEYRQIRFIKKSSNQRTTKTWTVYGPIYGKCRLIDSNKRNYNLRQLWSHKRKNFHGLQKLTTIGVTIMPVASVTTTLDWNCSHLKNETIVVIRQSIYDNKKIWILDKVSKPTQLVFTTTTFYVNVFYTKT